MLGNAANILGAPTGGARSQFDRRRVLAGTYSVPPGRFADRQDRRDRRIGFGVAANLIDADQTGFRKGITVIRHVQSALLVNE